MSLTWMTEETSWSDLIQITDNYVVHARGYTIGDDLWLDEYSLRSEHHRWWNDVVRHQYGLPELEPGGYWTVYADRHIDKRWAYWSINATGLFILQHPKKEYIDEETFDVTMETLDTLDAPDDAVIKFDQSSSSGSANSHTQAVLQKVNAPNGKYEYGSLDEIETIK